MNRPYRLLRSVLLLTCVSVTSIDVGAQESQERFLFDFGSGSCATLPDPDNALGYVGGTDLCDDTDTVPCTWEWITPGTFVNRGTIRDIGPDEDKAYVHALALPKTIPDELVTDSVIGNSLVFHLNVGVEPNNQPHEYWVAFHVGDIGNIGTDETAPTPLTGLEVSAGAPGSTSPVTRDELDVRTQTKKASYDDAKGGTRRIAFAVTLAAAEDTLEFKVTGAGASWQGLEVIRVRAQENPPIVFTHDNPTEPFSVVDTMPILQAKMTDFLDELYAGRGHGALTKLEILANAATTPKQRLDVAWARAYLIGWLVNWADDGHRGFEDASWRRWDTRLMDGLASDGTTDDTDLNRPFIDVLDELAVIEAVRDAADFVSLRYDVESYAVGKRFFDARGYTPTAFLPSEMTWEGLSPNLFTAEHAFEQITGDVFTAPEPGTFSQALFPKSQYYIAHSMQAQNTQHRQFGGSGSMPVSFVEHVDRFVGIFRSIYTRMGPDNTLFDSPEILSHTSYVLLTEDQGLISDEGFSDLSASGKLVFDCDDNCYATHLKATLDDGSDFWWKDDVTIDGGDAPSWAQELHRVEKIRRAGGTWWVDFRRKTDSTETVVEYGGGAGDDIEMIRAFTGTAGRLRRRGDDKLEEALLQFARFSLNGPDVDPDDRFYNGGTTCGTTDIEHATEYTHDSYWINGFLDFGAPYFVEAAMASMRNIDETTDPPCSDGVDNLGGPWAQVANSGDLHIKSYLVGASNVGLKSAATGPHDTTWTSRLIEPLRQLTEVFGLQGARQRLIDLSGGWYSAAMADFTTDGKPKGLLPATIDADTGFDTTVDSLGDDADPLAGPPGFTEGLAVPTKATLRKWFEIFLLLSRLHQAPNTPDGSPPTEWLQPLQLVMNWVHAHANDSPKPDHWMNYRNASIPVVFEARKELAALPTTPVPTTDMEPVPEHISANDYIEAYGTDYHKYVIALEAGAQSAPKDDMATELGHVADAMRYYYPILTSYGLFTDRILIDPNDAKLMMSGADAVTWFDPDPESGSSFNLAVLVTAYDREAETISGTADILDALVLQLRP